MRSILAAIIILIFTTIPTLYGKSSPYMQFNRMHTNTDASVISCIMQDSIGMIWVGTNKGLFSYDGYSFFKHKEDKGNYEMRIYCGLIFSDSIFLGTDNGLIIYDKRSGEYHKLATDKIKDIRCLALSGNELWVGTLNGLFRYNIATAEVYRFPSEMLPHKAIYSIIKSDNGTIYVGTYNGLCCIYENNDVKIINIPSDNKWKNIFVNVLFEDRKKQCIWIGTEGNLFCYDIQRQDTKLIPYFADNSIKSLNYDSERNLLIGTDNGLFIYSADGKTQRHYLHDSRNNNSIPNNIIWCITTDNEQNIWLGTDNGISFTDNNRQYTFIPVWELSNTNDGNMFYTIMTDSKGRNWFGGTDGLLLTEKHKDTANSRWFKVGKKGSELSHNRIRHIFEDSSQNLFQLGLLYFGGQ